MYPLKQLTYFLQCFYFVLVVSCSVSELPCPVARIAIEETPTNLSVNRDVPPTSSTNSNVSGFHLFGGDALSFPALLPSGESYQSTNTSLEGWPPVYQWLFDSVAVIFSNQLPSDLIRDFIQQQITPYDFYIQSFQWQPYVAITLCGLIVLSLLGPVLVLVHVCSKTTSPDCNNEGVWRCRLEALFLGALLALLGLGLGVMLVSNEGAASAAPEVPRALFSSLEDVARFTRNLRLQAEFTANEGLARLSTALKRDLDEIGELLGRPGQKELSAEISFEAASDGILVLNGGLALAGQQVADLLNWTENKRKQRASIRLEIEELRGRLETWRTLCLAQDKPICDEVANTVQTLAQIMPQLDLLLVDTRLATLARLGRRGISDPTDGDKDKSQEIGALIQALREAQVELRALPSQVERDTYQARQVLISSMAVQRASLADRLWPLTAATHQMTRLLDREKSRLTAAQEVWASAENFRWIFCLGSSLSLVFVWVLLLLGLITGCGAHQDKSAIFLYVGSGCACLLLFSSWAISSVTLLFAGQLNGGLCVTLYESPDFPELSRLLDGGNDEGGDRFLPSLLYRNSTLDIGVPTLISECAAGKAAIPVLRLEALYNPMEWSSAATTSWTPHLADLQFNASRIKQQLTPCVLREIKTLIQDAFTANITHLRFQISFPSQGLGSVTRQLESIAFRLTDTEAKHRLKAFVETAQSLDQSYAKSLREDRDELLYRLASLEVQLTPLRRRANQSLSQWEAIQFYLDKQADSIAAQKSTEYQTRLRAYLEQHHAWVGLEASRLIAPCRPLYEAFDLARNTLCRKFLTPHLWFWASSFITLMLFTLALGVSLRLGRVWRSSGSLTENSTEHTTWLEPGCWSSAGRFGSTWR